MTVWLTILGMALATYLTRVSPMLLFKDRHFPPAAREFLGLVPVAILTSLVAPALLVKEGGLFVSPANQELLAGLVCLAWAFKSKNMLQTILVGALTLVLLNTIVL